MRKPVLRNPARRLRHPSPAMVVSLIALFLSAGGASYAAVTIPDHSIGANQLKTFAVTNPKLATNSVGSRKIMPGAVGFYRVNRSEVQLRVTGSCTGANQAITSVSITGSTTCGTSSSSPAESDSGAGKATTIATGTTPTTVATYSAAGGSAYLVQADPSIEVSGAAGIAGAHVTVTCKLAAGTSTSAVETQNVTVNVDATGDTEYTSLPLRVLAPTSANAETVSLACTQTTSGSNPVAPTVAATSTIYALGVTPASTTTTTAAVRH
ncbi:MAG TPA: hypothetical protein VG228_10020 [Solirubrobacteraceae bacterium]|jgi:hypothetical protein|nr:hypothetical protein [Solirubrobacteraceae bacterium]